MRNSISSFADVIERLGEQNLADAIGAKRHQTRDWRIRDNIPAEWWSPVVDYAGDIGEAQITLELLASIASARRPNADVSVA